ncbi:MAG: type II and III secretion system protein [Waterburya sp.]
MTFADDFSTEEKSMAGDYPSAFGITFTPQVTGIAIAVAGFALAVYGFINFVSPAQKKYAEATTKKETLQGQLAQIKTGDLQLKLAQLEADLVTQKDLKTQVMSMFTREQDLDTLLLDLNNFVASNQGILVDYTPEATMTTVDDASLGEGVKGKLKRQSISLTLKGTFTETKQILQSLERLQPLLMVQTISSTVEEKPTAILASSRSELIPQKQAELKTQIKLDAIIPLSQAEIESAAKAAEEAAEGKEGESKEGSKDSQAKPAEAKK